MHFHHRGWWAALPRPVAVALAAPAVLAIVAVGLVQLGDLSWGPAGGVAAPDAAHWAARVSVVLAAGLAVLVLALRGSPRAWRQALPWWLLAVAALVAGAAGAWRDLTGWTAGSGFDPVGLLVAVTVVAALVLLPAPTEGRRGAAVRTALDAAAAGFAIAIPVAEALLPDSSWSLRTPAVVHGLVAVGVVTVAVAVVSRARRPGGLAIAPLGALALGAALLAIAAVLDRAGQPRVVALSLLTLAFLLWSLAGLSVSDDDTESDPEVRWRERIAVLVPLAPLAVATAVLGGSLVFQQPLTPVTLACALLLAATLIAGGVLARLDSLATERSLDDLVLKRTLSIGEREKWFRSLVQNSSDIITVVDVRGAIRYLTPSITRLLGHDPDQLVGTRIGHLLRPADSRRLDAALASAARSPGRPQTLEFAVWCKDGSWRDTETTITSLLHDPDIRGLVLNTRDVSDRRALQEQLTQQAFSDGLTGLANRSLFRSKLQTALKVALAPREVAVLFLDLDGFKAVNDAQGHHIGDELLALVAKRLTNSVRPGDLVARLGGDEFAVLVTGPGAEEGAVYVAERVRRAMSSPFVLDGREVLLGASTGVAVSDTGEETADQLQRNADLAMYRAKTDRERAFVRFEAQMHDALLARVKAENELRHAVSHGDLVLYYQPVVEITSGRIVGVEALVRWLHHEIGLVPPGEFIDLAEETGLVNDIGRWALQESARQGAAWQQYATPGGHFKMAVNVSARQLETGLLRLVRDVLSTSGLPGPALTLEMTESVLMERTEEVISLLKHMKKMGVRVAVDDFGTGYSSLSYLSRFPVDILKIDRTFVQHVGAGSAQGELVRTIVKLGESLRLDTVAEGIETSEQWDALRDLGCTFGQGYLFARPMPADEVEAMLAEQSGISTAPQGVSR